MKTWSSFTHPHVIPNLFKFLSYVEHKRRYFEVPNSCWSPLISIGSKILRKSMGTINCLITSILQNTFFYVQHKIETRTGLDTRESKWWQHFHFFGWIIPLNAKQCVLTNWHKSTLSCLPYWRLHLRCVCYVQSTRFKPGIHEQPTNNYSVIPQIL